MSDFKFRALGTEWCITIDRGELSEDDRKAVLGYISSFEKQFSRFLPDSEVNKFREAKKGDYHVSEEFSVMLKEGKRLGELTGGVYDPASGTLLERAGYNSKYDFSPQNTEEFVLPKWNIKGQILFLDGPTAFDLGGIGKGYCIDRVSDLLIALGYKYFVVDGGGDMFATFKEDGSPWNTAIAYPGKEDMAAGAIGLKNQGLAVSDSFRRRWGKWHHLVDPKKKQAIKNVIGAAAVTPNAFHADCMTSALFMATEDSYGKISREYDASYLVFRNDGTSLISPNWAGEIF